MKTKLKKYIKEILSFIVILLIFSNALSYYRATSLNKEKLNISNITLIDNTQFKINNDKPTLVHFWATWCPTCKIEAPNIQSLSEDYEVLTIAVSSKEDENIQKYLKEHNLNFKVFNDIDGAYARKFNISVFPTTLIYDKDKNVRFSEVGYTSTWGLTLRMWWANI